MKSFINVQDIGDLHQALAEAQEIKNDRYKYQHLGKNKTLMMIFFNNSLRTRLSTQKAAMNLGMNVIVLDVNAGAWKLETERGVIMDGDKSEHLLEAIPVMGCYCDLIGIRSFAGLTDREYDYAETVLNQFIKYSGRPVFAMETATVHPLQAFADLITIEEHKKVERPKVVLTWAPHCRALPQAVPNSFAPSIQTDAWGLSGNSSPRCRQTPLPPPAYASRARNVPTRHVHLWQGTADRSRTPPPPRGSGVRTPSRIQ